MRKKRHGYKCTDRHLPQAVKRFAEKFPKADLMQVRLCPDAVKTYSRKFGDFIPFDPGPIYVKPFADPFVGLFEPDTILFDFHMLPQTRTCRLTFRQVQQAEWNEGFLPNHEAVSWMVEEPVSEFRRWCRDGRGIDLRPHRRVWKENRGYIEELVFNDHSSRIDFLLRWNTPKP